MRIISFAPSATEILYRLGLGDNIAGVTDFCKYPPEAALKEKIGAHASFNYEAIIRLKPDLAVILKEQRDLIDFFEKYGIRYVMTRSDSVEEIIESVLTIAGACAVPDMGDSLARDLRRRMERILPPTSSTADIPKVLLCADRENAGSGAVGKCFAAGASSFYNQLIETAGGINVLNNVAQAYPAIGAEAIARLAPDVIVDLSSACSDTPEENCNDWAAHKTVSAVRNGRVHCLRGDHLTVPGPRFILILDDFKRIFE